MCCIFKNGCSCNNNNRRVTTRKSLFSKTKWCLISKFDAFHSPITMIIIKIGGAALTDKTKEHTLCDQGILQILQPLQQLRQTLILIHGAGSFGHMSAARTGLVAGGNLLPSTSHLPNAIADNRRSVTRLNHMVVDELINMGIPAVGVSPFPHWVCSNRKVITVAIDQVQAVVDAGMLPVLHGDVVLDTVLGCTILSGDAVVEKLCQELKPKVAVFMVRCVLAVFLCSTPLC